MYTELFKNKLANRGFKSYSLDMRNGRIFSTGLLAVSMVVMATPSQSGDQQWSWTGFYAEAILGGNYSPTSAEVSGTGDFLAFVGDGSLEPVQASDVPEMFQGDIVCVNPYCVGSVSAFSDAEFEAGTGGLVGGIGVGYDYQVSAAVLGVNASFVWSNRQYEFSGRGGIGGGITDGSLTEASGNSSVLATAELGSSFIVGGRIGVLATERNLIYASGGLSIIDATLSTSFEGQADAGDLSSGIQADFHADTYSDEWLFGYYAGLGYERLLGSNISIKAEYRYYDYGTILAAASSDALCPEPCERDWSVDLEAEADLSDHSIFAAVSLRF